MQRVIFGLSTLLASSALAPVAAFAQLEEVVITAQRVEENLQRAAITVDTISSEELTDAGVGSSPGDLNRLIPSAQIAVNDTTSPSLYVRGIGNFTSNPYSDSTVGFNYDGVPITRAPAVIGMFYDLSRVEVLKGPQGTLYGRNNTGGAINVLPAHPQLGEYSGSAALTAGNYDLRQATGYINVPLGNRAAARAAFNYIDRDGYYDNGTADDVGRSMRLQLRVEPTSTIDFNLGFDYHKQGGRGGGATLLNTPTQYDPDGPGGLPPYGVSDGRPYGGDAWRHITSPANCDGVSDGVPYDLDDYLAVYCANTGYGEAQDSFANAPPRVSSEFFGFTGTLNWALPWATLTVVPALRISDQDSLNRGATPNIKEIQESTTKSLEVRLASDPTNQLYWLLGAYGLDETVDADFRVDQAFLKFTLPLNLTNKSQAAFGSARYSITDQFRISAGIRYTHDEKTFDGAQLGFGAPFVVDAESTWDEITYRAGVEYDVASNSMLFVTYDTGYKAGGFFFATSIHGPTFDPETVSAYTIGSRNMFFDRRWLLNVDLFHYLYRDQQVSQSAIDRGSGLPIFATMNVGAIDYMGIEVDTQFYLTSDTLLHADVQYLDSEFAQPPVAPDVNAAVPDAGDRRAPNAPEWTATFGVQQTFRLGAGSVIAKLNGQYRSETLVGNDFTPWQYVDAVTTGDALLRYEPEGGDWSWSITGFVNNFTDEEVPVFMQGTGAPGSVFPAVSVPTAPRAVYRAPRTYGVQVSASF